METINGYFKLSWRERTGYCSGELAMNLIYQTVSIWLMFYYTNVYGLNPGIAAMLFLVVRVIDVIWDPFVGTFGEFVSGRRVAGIVTALICIFMKAGMALGGVIPGLVLEFVGFNSELQAQSAFTLEGIVWLVTFIPALLMILAAFVIGRYELSDKKMDEINNAITSQ